MDVMHMQPLAMLNITCACDVSAHVTAHTAPRLPTLCSHTRANKDKHPHNVVNMLNLLVRKLDLHLGPSLDTRAVSTCEPAPERQPRNNWRAVLRLQLLQRSPHVHPRAAEGFT